MSGVIKLSEHKKRPCWYRPHEEAKKRLNFLVETIKNNKHLLPARVGLHRNQLIVEVPTDREQMIAQDVLKIMGNINGLSIKVKPIPLWRIIFMQYSVIHSVTV